VNVIWDAGIFGTAEQFPD